MRRLLLIAVAALALAGCGSSSSASNPLSSELSYFPADSPFVLSIQTDPNSTAIQQAHQLIARFPLASLGQAALKAKLSQQGINYDTDVRPLFGNPLLFGFPAAPASGSGATSQILVVWETKDGNALNSLLKKELHGTPSAGTRDGAKLYQSGTQTVAIDGQTVILGSSQSIVATALDRHAHGGGLSSADYTHDLSGLPQNALVEAFGNVAGLLSSPGAAKARQVPWVAALRSYGTAITVNQSGITFQYHVDSTGASLSPAQLPIAPGTTTPGVAGTFPIVVSLRDPAQLFSFLVSAQQATGSSSYASFLARQAAVRRKTGVDLTTLYSLLTGTANGESDTHALIGRAAIGNPAAVQAILAKLVRDPLAFSSSATSVARGADGIYLVNEGAKKLAIGVVGNQLLAGMNATPSELLTFAGAPLSEVPGAQGSFVFRISLPALFELALRRAPSSVIQTVLSSLGDLTGWTSTSTSGITGTASLGLK